MTAVHEDFWENEICESAAHDQHFKDNVTHMLECQCKKRCKKE